MANAFRIDVINEQTKTGNSDYISVETVKRAHTSDMIRKYGITDQNFSPKATTTKQVSGIRLPLQSDIPDRFQMIRGSLPNRTSQDTQNMQNTEPLSPEAHSGGQPRGLSSAPRPQIQVPNGSSSSENLSATTGSLIEVEIMKNITWKDGYLPREPSKVPNSVLTLIRNHLKEFENEVITTTWGKKKGCDEDEGRKVLYVLDDKPTSDIVPVARYLYGEKKQFLVAWLPDQTFAGSHHLHIVRFDSPAQTSATVERDGIIWKLVPYTTWVPSDRYIKKTIFRLLQKSTVRAHEPSSQEKTQESLQETPFGPSTNATGRETANTASVRSSVDISETRAKRALEQDSRPAEVRHSYTPEASRTPASEAKRRRISINLPPLPPPPICPTTPRLFDTSTMLDSPSLNVVDISTHVNPVSTSSAMDPYARLVRKSSEKAHDQGVNEGFGGVFVMCKDAHGNIKDTFPFRECDTAQKLFDAVCVSGIVRVEPPGTRLLKIAFLQGEGGCIRPDNQQDFEKVVLRNVRAFAKFGTVEMTVTFLR